MPDAVAAVPGLAENLLLQDTVAQQLKGRRHALGALSLQTIEARPLFEGDTISGLEVQVKNRATELIEDFMIAANGVTVRFLAAQKFPSYPSRRAHAKALGPHRRSGRRARTTSFPTLLIQRRLKTS